MATKRYSGVALFSAAALVALSAASCSSEPGTYDQGSDEPTGSVQEAVSGAVGNWTGFTNGQCVSGVYHFFEARFGASFVGLCAQGANVGICRNCGACMLWSGSKVEPNPAVWNRYAWGTVKPQLYDMVVYPPRGGVLGYGHVAAVDHMTSSNPAAWQSLYVMDTNWYGNEKMATAVHTVSRAPSGIYRLKSLTKTTVDVAPHGFLDAASCAQVAGWAQDSSVATSAIKTDLYFNGPAGNASASSIRLTADEARPDLCAPLGSCNHAWSTSTPRGTMDGKPHQVYAYGIDSAGGTNTLLTNSPKTFTCPAPAIPTTSVKRAIPSMKIVDDWKMSTFFDMAPYTDAELAVVKDGAAFDAAPVLEKATGTPDIFVVDGKQRRHVTGTASFDAWRFTSAMVKTVTAAELAALPKGLDWPATPLLVKGASATVYLLDITVASPPSPPSAPVAAPSDETPPVDSPADPDNDAPPATDAASSDDSSSSGCSISHAADPQRGSSGWLLVALAGLALVRARRSAVTSSASRACSKQPMQSSNGRR